MLDIQTLKQQAEAEIKNSNNDAELNAVRVKFLGKTGLISELLKKLKKTFQNDQKKEYGQSVNGVKNHVEDLLKTRND